MLLLLLLLLLLAATGCMAQRRLMVHSPAYERQATVAFTDF